MVAEQFLNKIFCENYICYVERSSQDRTIILSEIYPKMELLYHMVILFLIFHFFRGNGILFLFLFIIFFTKFLFLSLKSFHRHPQSPENQCL